MMNEKAIKKQSQQNNARSLSNIGGRRTRELDLHQESATKAFSFMAYRDNKKSFNI
jgi:hypothetical protein